MTLPVRPQLGVTIRWARWAAIVPAVALGWAVAVITGFALLSYAESLCPPESMISGMCTADWFPRAQLAVFCFSTAFAATLIVLATVVVAPSYKARAAWIAYGGGAIAAVSMGVAAQAWFELMSALLAGALAAMSASAFVHRAER